MDQAREGTADGAQLVLELEEPAVLLRGSRIACVNEAALALLGEGLESDLVGRDFLSRIVDDAPHLVAARLRVAATGGPSGTPMPTLLARAGGAPVAVEISLTCIREASGPAVVVAFPQSRWLEDRSQYLEALNDRFRPMLDQIAECVIVQDLKARILLANRATCDLLDLDESLLLGRSLLEFVPEEEQAAVLERAASRLAGNVGIYSYELNVLVRGGEQLRMKLDSTVLAASERPIAILVVARPADDRLRDAMRLRRERDDARAASRSKSELVATMAHELRTPMNVVFGMIDMALDANLPPSAQQAIAGAREAALRLRALIDDLLDLSRAESGQLALRREIFSLRDRLAEAIDPLRFLAARRRLEVICTVDKTVPDELIGDPARLAQVVVNLVGNAIKYTPEGRVEVRVDLASTPTPNPGSVHLSFSVQDTGIGIPKEQRSRIFEPFHRADAVERDGPGGTGLGLAIAREIVAGMGGQVWVESELGRGSVFHFTAVFGTPGVGKRS